MPGLGVLLDMQRQLDALYGNPAPCGRKRRILNTARHGLVSSDGQFEATRIRSGVRAQNVRPLEDGRRRLSIS